MDGLGVDVTQIAADELLNSIKRLPEGNAVEMLKKLPAGIMEKVCQQGVKENLQQYIIPALLAGIGGGLAVGFYTHNVLYGAIGAIVCGAIIYFIRQPDGTETTANA